MQTELILGLLPTSETESIITSWRQKTFNNFPMVHALPPLIPLAFPATQPSFDQLRKIAQQPWPASRILPEARSIDQPNGQYLVLPLESANWEAYRRSALARLADTGTIDDPRAFDVPIGPWFFLGSLAIDSVALFPLPVAVPALLQRTFRAPLLCLMRIQLEFGPMADFISWELLARNRVKKLA